MFILRCLVYVVVTLMLAPVIVCIPVALTSGGTIAFPPPGFSLNWFSEILSDTILIAAAERSLVLALVVAVLSILFALPCAFVIGRKAFQGRTATEVAILSPRMVPQIAFSLAVLIFFERIGVAGSDGGLMVAYLVASIPFAYRTLGVGISGLDVRLERSSAILGATYIRTLFLVIFPQLKPSLIAAFIFSFILTFNNVTIALFLSGIGERTLPVEMFHRMYVGGMTPIIPAISVLLATFGVIVFVIVDRTVGFGKYWGSGN